MTEEKQHFKIHIERRDKEGGEWVICYSTNRSRKDAEEMCAVFNDKLKHHEYRISR